MECVVSLVDVIDPLRAGLTREDVRLALEAENIESRPVFKPMHSQPAFQGCRARGGQVADRLFEQGLCLPSGSSLTEPDMDRVISIVRRTFTGASRFAGVAPFSSVRLVGDDAPPIAGEELLSTAGETP
jgi:dTDP-4-amino-4,6-dideoxygalactose transaminase